MIPAKEVLHRRVPVRTDRSREVILNSIKVLLRRFVRLGHDVVNGRLHLRRHYCSSSLTLPGVARGLARDLRQTVRFAEARTNNNGCAGTDSIRH